MKCEPREGGFKLTAESPLEAAALRRWADEGRVLRYQGYGPDEGEHHLTFHFSDAKSEPKRETSDEV